MILLYESTVHLLQTRQTHSDATGTSSCDLFDPLKNASMIKNYEGLSYTFANPTRQSVCFCLPPEYGVIGKTLVLLPLWVAVHTVPIISAAQNEAIKKAVRVEEK